MRRWPPPSVGWCSIETAMPIAAERPALQKVTAGVDQKAGRIDRKLAGARVKVGAVARHRIGVDDEEALARHGDVGAAVRGQHGALALGCLICRAGYALASVRRSQGLSHAGVPRNPRIRAPRNIRWQSFIPPAAGKSRRFRGLICHRRSQSCRAEGAAEWPSCTWLGQG